MIRTLLLLTVLITACAPVPMTRERALHECRSEARLADGIAGSVGVGVGSGGGLADGELVVTSRVFDPRSERAVLAECMDRRMAGRPEPTIVGVTLGTGS
ncbi:hypothetical protein [uncultured Jannaschia sp.]|uniref:hypothetical protein n=1 Tax=uncultured Jannaschia sp. TaxID=293347 RepID=UPI0026308123|nr:hypothetical protein [uncultured Jannaschia sp.]